jgi:hypothetical protein
LINIFKNPCEHFVLGRNLTLSFVMIPATMGETNPQIVAMALLMPIKVPA